MNFDLYTVRRFYNLNQSAFARAAGLAVANYAKYERKNEIPSKYLYQLWLNLPDFPLPNDFFYYTSITLDINMRFYAITQKEICKIFGYSSQAVVSKYLKLRVPMYEKKECFRDAFPELVLPVALTQYTASSSSIELTHLSACGMMTDSYLTMAKRRGEAKKKKYNKTII